jgi:hypothetical protein
MRTTVLIALLLTLPGLVRGEPGPGDSAPDQGAIIKYGVRAVPRALNFAQGDRASLVDAEADFTAKGWESFMHRLSGWLDDHGAPKYTSTFTQGERTPRVHTVDGAVVLTLYGELKQQNRNEHGGVSTTTYSVAVDATISTKPLKVDRLEERTCGKTPCE